MARRPTKELIAFFEKSLAPEDQRRFVADLDGAEALVAELPDAASPAKLARAIVDGAERHGLIDAAFFAALRGVRPRRVAEIDTIEGLFGRVVVKEVLAAEEVPFTKVARFHVPFARKEPLVGREDALAELHRRFTQQGVRSVVITGVGGLGKTQLAIEYAYRHRDDYPGGIVWLTADQPWEPQLSRLTTEAAWMHPGASSESKVAEAKENLPLLERALLIVDNVIERAAVDAIVPPTSRSVRLLTSQAGIGLPPLPIDLLSPADALSLFVNESGRAADDDARRLVERLDGWPLAIELAGAYLRHTPAVSVHDWLTMLDAAGVDSPALHDDAATSSTNHTRDLRATLRASRPAIDANPLLAELLDVLAWSGPAAMSRGLLAAMMGRPEVDLIHPLGVGTRFQFLRLEGEGRYRVHRFLQAVVREDSQTGDEVLHARLRRGVDWFVARRQAFGELALFEAELAHVRAWQALAIERGWRWEEAVTRWLEAYPVFHAGEWMRVLPLLKAAEAAMVGVDDKVLRMRVVGDLASAYGNVGPSRLADTYRERALAETEGWDDATRAERVHALNCAANSQDGPAALAAAEEAVGLAAALSATSVDRVAASGHLAMALVRAGRLDDALAVARVGVELTRAAIGEDRVEFSEQLRALAIVHSSRAEVGPALEAARAALALAQAIDPRNQTRQALCEVLIGELLWQLATKKPDGGLILARDAVKHLEGAVDVLRRTAGCSSHAFTWAAHTLALALWDLGWLEHDGRKQVRAIRVLDELIAAGDPDLANWQQASALRDELAAKGIQGFSIPKRPAGATRRSRGE